MLLPRLLITTSITAVIALTGALSAAEGGWSRAQQVWRDGGTPVQQERTSAAPAAISAPPATAMASAPWSRANAVWRDGLAPLPTTITTAPAAPVTGTWSRANLAVHGDRDNQARIAAGASATHGATLQ